MQPPDTSGRNLASPSAGYAAADGDPTWARLFEAAPDAMLVFDDDRCVRCNAAALRLFGCSREELVGQPPWRHSPPLQPDGETQAVAERRWLAAARGEEPRRFPWRVRRPDRTEVDVEVRLSCVTGGATTLTLAVARDLTAPRPIERALDGVERRFRELPVDLRTTEGLFRAVSETAPVGIFLTNARGDVVYLNDQVKLILRIDEFAGRIFERVHPEDRELIQAQRRNPLDDSEREFRILVDDEVRWVRARARPLHDDRGALVGSVGVVEDVTERRRAEAERERLLEALREADRRKDEFIGMLSHELRNPLTPIRAGLAILERVAPDGDQALRARAVIDRQVGHLSRIIDDLLDVTRVAGGKVMLRLELLDLDEVVLRTVEDHRAEFVARGVELDARAAPAPAWVKGDRTRLAQVVGNLLQNAVKFTPTGGSTTVSVARDVAARRATLVVRDTGRGIEPAFLPQLFNPFAQADASPDRGEGGLGLGLALVKGLAELHGGSVSAASPGLGRGAAFTVTLPLEDAGPATVAPERTEPRRVPRRVVLIDDNRDVTDTLRDALELSGHVVAVAHDGPAGLELTRALRPAVVLCDIGLPRQDGYWVARALRADAEIRGVALVAMTGYARPEDVARALAAGFDAHLAKPATLEELERVLAAALEARERVSPPA